MLGKVCSERPFVLFVKEKAFHISKKKKKAKKTNTDLLAFSRHSSGQFLAHICQSKSPLSRNAGRLCPRNLKSSVAWLFTGHWNETIHLFLGL